MSRIILDLCGGTGAWSEPYRAAGYDVRLVTAPEHDGRLYIPPDGVHGVLAAPPCTMFSRAGAWCKRTPEQMLEALSVVDACLRIVHASHPEWWALENPIGKLKKYLGEPAFKCDPCDFGDPWTKRMWLWGHFTPPWAKPCEPGWFHTRKRGRDRTTMLSSSNKTERSRTSAAFARAFFEANP